MEKDISSFIKECSTGQEIPDPPKFIDFCRADLNDTASVSDDGEYSVAQFQRVMNPSFRTSSPQPSYSGPHHEAQLSRGQEDNSGNNEYRTSSTTTTPRKPVATAVHLPETRPSSRAQQIYQKQETRPLSRAQQDYHSIQTKDFAEVPHNEYPMDGMTQFCRTGPPSQNSSVVSALRPASRSSISEYSNPTSFTSAEPSLLSMSPTKPLSDLSTNSGPTEDISKKRSGFFQNRSPFRRKSQTEKERPPKPLMNPSTGNKTGWTPTNTASNSNSRPLIANKSIPNLGRSGMQPSASPEPADLRAQFQLNVGNNVFDVASPDALVKHQQKSANPQNDFDPIAQALADLKGVTKQSSVRISADRYAGIASPAPGGLQNSTPSGMPANRGSPLADRSVIAAQRGTPPPSYDPMPVSRLGAPQPAFTSRQMQQTTQKYIDQGKNIFQSPSRHNSYDPQGLDRASPQARPGAQNNQNMNNRATSPTPLRNASPQPDMYNDPGRPNIPRATSPSPYATAANMRPRGQSVSPAKNGGRSDSFHSYNAEGSSPGNHYQQHQSRAVSPQPQFRSSRGSGSQEMALQLAPVSPLQQGHPNNMYGVQPAQSQPQMRGRPSGGSNAGRPVSQYGSSAPNSGGPGADPNRMRSRSAAPDGRQQYTRDGRPILHFCKLLPPQPRGLSIYPPYRPKH